MKKIAVIGASYLQLPLIEKARQMGCETHVFAWAANDVGEKAADFFYPVSIVEKEKILEICQNIGIDGICSIASDLAMVTVNYVAEQLGLTGNTVESTYWSTNKYAMRKAFEEHGDPSPQFQIVENVSSVDHMTLEFPVIVKPTDRSGSRGICKAYDRETVRQAVQRAIEESFEKKALIEEFVDGREYSVECISCEGVHKFLAVTQKYTTGEPDYIETGHIQPAALDEECVERLKNILFHALDTLGIRNGASHSEVKINERGEIRIIEIGGRMGGDFIGSDLVFYSTGIDFVKAVIQICLGEKPDLEPQGEKLTAGVRFILNENDKTVYDTVLKETPSMVKKAELHETGKTQVKDSSTRWGYFLVVSKEREDVEKNMPKE